MKNLKKALVLLLTSGLLFLVVGASAFGFAGCNFRDALGKTSGKKDSSNSKKDSSKPPFTFSVTDEWGEEGDWTDNY